MPSDGASGIRTRDLLAASQALSQLSYGPARANCSEPLPRRRFPKPSSGHPNLVTEKPDYSPLVEKPQPAEAERERRLARPFVLGAYSFLIYALILAAIVGLVIWLVV